MARPWEQYQSSAAPTQKPWEKFAAPQAAEPIDYLEGTSFPQRMAIGAGKATNDFLGTFGLNPYDSYAPADEAINSDTAGQVGSGLAQAGMMYVGGSALKGAGAGIKGIQAAPKVAKAAGGALEWLGAGATAPTSYKQAATAGGLFGVAATPGDAVDRAGGAVAGATGGAAGLAVGRGLQATGSAVKNFVKGSSGAQELESAITAKLKVSGLDFHALPRAVQEQITKVGKTSLDALDNLKPDELKRMADFEALNIKPTKGWVTRDPNAWWEENTLNTVDDGIAARFKDANQTLLQKVTQGAPDATDYQIGRKLSDSVAAHDAAMKSNVDQLYTSARNMAGRDISLDPHRFVNNASIELDQQMLGSKLPSDTLSWFQKVTAGKEPFDMGTAMQRLQAINGRIYATADPAEAKALGVVKTHLINALDDYGSEGAGVIGGQQAEQAGLSQAFRGARQAAAQRFKFQESNPLIDRVLSGKFTPEQLPDVVGKMRVDDLESLSKVSAEHNLPVMQSLQDAAKAFIRDSATLQGETGGAFTVNGMRKALDKIGPEKGLLLFGKDGWDGYQQVLRAAGNIHNAPLKPAGSTTASNALRFLQKIPLAGRGLELGFELAGKGHQMVKVNGLLNPKASMPLLDPAASHMGPLVSGGLLGFTGN